MDIELFIQGYDAQGAYNALFDELVRFVESWTEIIAETADANIRYYPELRGQIRNQVATLVDSIVGDVFPEGENAWMAWLEEYGKGSEMDTSNPSLYDYIGSEYWNPSRGGFEITGRPKGEYLGLDGVYHDSSGRFEGKNLEEMSQESWFADWLNRIGADRNDMLPTPPTHFMRDALESNRNRIIEELSQLIASFDWGAFFIVK